MRADHDLAPLLRYENIARFEDGVVKILDRRIYPAKKEFVTCRDYHEVALAIKQMVTQSAGPYTAGPMGLALAAYSCREQSAEKQISYLDDAYYVLSNARPSTAKRMALVIGDCLKEAKLAIANGSEAYIAILSRLEELNDERYERIDKVAKNLCTKLSAHSNIMTYCFAETVVGMLLRNCKEQGKNIKLFVCETRPYFQGARLTASCAHDMGFDTTVITDGMPAFVMDKEGIDVFTTAADAICADGSVINKIGTCNTAIVAKHYNVPYYVTGAPEIVHPTGRDVPIELRDGEFTLQAMGVRVADAGLKGYYPSFDMTPPELVTGIVTDYGIFAPSEIPQFFEIAGTEFRLIV